MSRKTSKAEVGVIARVRQILDTEPGGEVQHLGGGREIKLRVMRPSSTDDAAKGKHGNRPANENQPKVFRAGSAGAKGGALLKEHSYNFSHIHVKEDNVAIFGRSVAPVLADMTSRGRSCAVFAYGYTGTGKSVTIYGSKHAGPGNELGVAELAAHQLLTHVAELGEGYAMRVSMCEIAGKDCRDLLDGKAPLRVRAGKDGGVHVRKLDGGEFITRKLVRSMDEFMALLKEGVASRKVGSSTVHDESSRSHAVIELEVTTDGVLALEAALDNAQNGYANFANSRDDGLRERYNVLLAEGGQAAVDESGLLAEMEQQLGAEHQAGTQAITDAREALEAALKAEVPAVRGRIAFIDMAGNDCAREPSLLRASLRNACERPTVLPPAEGRNGLVGTPWPQGWESKDRGQCDIRPTHPAPTTRELTCAPHLLAHTVWRRGPHLPGEQSGDVQTKEARVEHAAINSSLLAVKECLRAVSSGTRVPFRNSVLTHLLQRHFAPGARLLMIATITPSDDDRLVRQSVNTLNYAKLVT